MSHRPETDRDVNDEMLDEGQQPVRQQEEGTEVPKAIAVGTGLFLPAVIVFLIAIALIIYLVMR